MDHTKKRKLHTAKLDTDDMGKVDQISHLPEPVIHHIMSFLPTVDVTKISILSKNFRSLWSSFPIIDLDQALFNKSPGMGSLYRSPRNKKFLNYVSNSIQCRRIQTVLAKFRLRVNFSNVKYDYHINNAIEFALENGVKELYLDIYLDGGQSRRRYYSLPNTFSAKSITVLKLNGFELDLNYLILNCPLVEILSLSQCDCVGNDIKIFCGKLKTIEFDRCTRLGRVEIALLSLESFMFNHDSKIDVACEIDIAGCEFLNTLILLHAKISDEWIEGQVSKLGLLETLKLIECKELKNFRVSNEELKTVELNKCKELRRIEIRVPNLNSFQYNGMGKSMACEIDVTDCINLKRLTISSANIKDGWLEEQVSNMHDLEDLEIGRCNKLERVDICNENIKKIHLIGCSGVVEVKIDAPNLISFMYYGKVVQFSLMNCPRLVIATLSFEKRFGGAEWYVMLRDTLTLFDHCKSLMLDCYNDEDLIFPEELRESLVPPLYDLKFLKIIMDSSSKIRTELVDSLLWLVPHPETLCFDLGSMKKFIEFQYTKTVANYEDPFCCRAQPIKCWRHYLKKVEMQKFEDDDEERNNLEKYFSENMKRCWTEYGSVLKPLYKLAKGK